MKQLILFCFLLPFSLFISAQDPFTAGLVYFEKGMYSKADSIFSELIIESPEDKNVLFNLGITRLYTGDTCKFCETMLDLCHSYQEIDACNLYFSICGSADTIYRDKNYMECDRVNAQFTEITETHNDEDFKTVYIHDKKKKEASHIVNADFMNPIKTDIIAVYKLYNDTSKIYTFTLTPPEFYDDYAYRDYMKNNSLIKICKERLSLKNIRVMVDYIVDNRGNIKDITIGNIVTYDTENKSPKDSIYRLFRYKNVTVENMDIMKQYIDSIIKGMPRRKPGKYKGQNVDYLVHEVITF